MSIRLRWVLLLTCVLATKVVAADNPFLGYWGLTLPNGAAGWLGVEQEGGKIKASVLWAVGSVEPTATAEIDKGELVMTRVHSVDKKDSTGKKIKVNVTEVITATADGDYLSLVSKKPRENGKGEDVVAVKGRRQPPIPPAPDISHLKYGEAIKLFNGKSLSGWQLTDTNAINGWSVKDGILVNAAKQEEGKPHKNYGNLRTDREFEDFNIKLQVRLEKGGNSGVYLRGMYEIQVADTYGKPPDTHNMGALYSRIKPRVSAELPPGDWQTLDITFVQQHVTIVLNGTLIIENQPVLGCTGGALWSDVTRPGPIYLQGDHTASEYRNIMLRSIVK